MGEKSPQTNDNSPYISIFFFAFIFLSVIFTSKMDKYVHFNEVLFLLTIPKQDKKYLSASSLTLQCTVSAQQAPLSVFTMAFACKAKPWY